VPHPSSNHTAAAPTVETVNRTRATTVVLASAAIVAAAALIAVPAIAGASPGRTTVAVPDSSTLASSTGSLDGLQVVGYAEGGTPASKLRASMPALTTIGADGVNLTTNGADITATSPETLALLATAHANSKRAELLVGNFDGKLGDFSPTIAAKLLRSPDNIRAVAAALVAEVKANGWDGVSVDLESLRPADSDGLTALMRALRSGLDAAGGGKSLSIDLMATTGDYADEGYDLAALGVIADHVVLMGYDQHGPTWSRSGPVGGLPWVKKTLAPLLAAVPAEKVQLGIAGYGYSWPTKGKTGRVFSDAGARAAVKKQHAKAVWSATQGEWHAKLKSGTVIWWSDKKSFTARAALATTLGLGGVAVWSLGLSDPIG